MRITPAAPANLNKLSAVNPTQCSGILAPSNHGQRETRIIRRALRQQTETAMYRAPDGTDTAPLHPGEILRVDILPGLGMTPGKLAVHLGVPRSTLDNLLAERSAITPDLARRLGHALGYDAHHWLALQMQHDLWKAAETEVDGIRPLVWSRTSPPHTNLRHRPASAS